MIYVESKTRLTSAVSVVTSVVRAAVVVAAVVGAVVAAVVAVAAAVVPAAAPSAAAPTAAVAAVRVRGAEEVVDVRALGEGDGLDGHDEVLGVPVDELDGLDDGGLAREDDLRPGRGERRQRGQHQG